MSRPFDVNVPPAELNGSLEPMDLCCKIFILPVKTQSDCPAASATASHSGPALALPRRCHGCAGELPRWPTNGPALMATLRTRRPWLGQRRPDLIQGAQNTVAPPVVRWQETGSGESLRLRTFNSSTLLVIVGNLECILVFLPATCWRRTGVTLPCLSQRKQQKNSATSDDFDIRTAWTGVHKPSLSYLFWRFLSLSPSKSLRFSLFFYQKYCSPLLM